MEQLAAWMEEQRGEMGLALEEPWVQPLGELHGKGKWSVKNVVKEGQNVTRTTELVWAAIIAECARMIADAGQEPPSALDQTLAVQWALTPTVLFQVTKFVTREEVMATIETPHVRDAPPGATRPPQIVPAVVPAIPPALPAHASRLALEDMLAQGANSVTELLFSSVSLELGRPAVDKELEGGEYASSLAICHGIIKATKSRGFKGFSEILAAAKIDGDLMGADRHMEKLQGRLMTTSSPPYHMTTGSRFTQFWSRAKTVSEDGRIVAYYVLSLTDLFSCRGMPTLYDHELMRQAERAVMLSDAKARAPKAMHLGGQMAPEGYSGYSSHGSSVSTTPSARIDEMSDKIMAQLVNLTEGQTALTTKLASQEKLTKSFDDRLNSLASRVGREGGPRGGGGARPGSESGGECIACGKTGHKMAKCPVYAAFQKSQKAADDE